MALKRFLALDIGASTLKLAEFASTGVGNLTLINFGRAPLPVVDPTSEENRNTVILEALKKILAERQFRSRSVAISVSGQTVLTRFMKLPATDEAKMRQMVRYEAAQNVPFPIEEVVWDFQVIGGKGEAELDVVLVAIKSEIIEGLNQVVEEAGLSVEVVDVAPIALYNAIRYNYESAEGCTLVLDIGGRTTNLIFIEGKKVFMRNVPIAGNTISQNVSQEFEIPYAEADDLKMRQGFVGLGGAYEEPELESAAKLSKIIRNVMTRLHADIARSINFYKTQQGGTAPKRLLLCGGTSIVQYADYFFKDKMEIEVEYFNPFKNVPIQVSAEELEKVAHSMGEVVGLGLRLQTDCPIEVNLIPPSVTKQREFKRKTPFFVASLVGIIAVLWAYWLYYYKEEKLLTEQLEVLTRDVDELTGIQSKIGNAKKDRDLSRVESEQIMRVIKARTVWIDFLTRLNGLVPADIWIVELRPQNDGKDVTFIGAGGGGGGGGGGPVVGRGRRGPAPGPAVGDDGAAAAAAGKNVITEFEIKGICLNNHKSSEPLKPITEFQGNLEKSPMFSEIKLLDCQAPTATDWTFSFRFRAKLKKEEFIEF